MCQIWHFELATLLHLPFMLRAASNRRYEYSRISCLNACRDLIKRWVSIRETNGTFYFSNLLDFEAFTAATTLILGLLVSLGDKFQDTSQEQDEDSELVEMVVRNFERLKRHGSQVSVGSQSILVIQTLQGLLRGESSSGQLRLEIPFFGTIKVAHCGTIEPLEGERILGANTGHNNIYARSEKYRCSLPRRKKIARPGWRRGRKKKYSNKELQRKGVMLTMSSEGLIPFCNSLVVIFNSPRHLTFKKALTQQSGRFHPTI